MAVPILRLNVDDNPRIIVKQDILPVHVTGNTVWNFTGSGGTTIIENPHKNIVDVIIFSMPPTGVSITQFDSYTGVTEIRLQGIENDINYISGQTALKLNTSTFNTYTGTTAPLQFAAKIHTHAQYMTSGQTNNLINQALLGYWNSGETINYISGQGFLTGVTAAQITGVTDSLYLHTDALNGYWNSGQTVGYINAQGFLTGVTWNDVSGKPSLALQSDFTSHTGNTNIHFTQAQINIAQSQVTGLVSALAGKSNTGHTHAYSTITNIPSFVGSGNTIVSQVGNTYRIYSPTGGTADWLTLANRPAWLTGTTLNAFQLAHSHSQYLTGITAAQITGVTNSLYLHTDALNGYWNSGQTVGYINAQGFLTGVTWSQVTNKPTWTGSGITTVQLVGSTYRIYTPATDISGKLNTTTFSTYTGTTAPNQFASKTVAITGATNLGTGTTIYTSVANNKIQLKSLKVLGGISISNDANHITISGGSGGGVSTATFNAYTGTTAPATYTPLLSAINTQTGTTYTVQATDSGKIIEFTATGATTITLPSGTTCAVGFQCVLVNVGGGDKTVAKQSPDTLSSLSSKVKISGAFNAGTVYRRASGKWVLFGNLS